MATVQTAQGLLSGLDLNKLLVNANIPAQQAIMQQPLPVQAVPTKKKAPTAEQKRISLVLNMLTGNGNFGLDYCNLKIQLAPEDLDLFIKAVKAMHNLP